MIDPRKGATALALLSALTLPPLLSGCFTLAVAGVAGGSMAATDRRTVGTQVEDRAIQLKASNRVSEEFGDLVHVNLTAYNRKVLITGEVPDAATKARVGSVVGGVENVNLVVNELAIEGKSSFAARSNDALITGKVKAVMLDAKDVFANAFKVTTERGNVYLMGLVTAREAQRAAEVASTVSGVARVVKVVDIIGEEDLKRMTITPAPAEPTSGGPRNGG